MQQAPMHEPVLTVLDKLYAAALLPAEWPSALDALAQACGAVGITVSRGPMPEPALASPAVEASTVAYASTWWEVDRRTARLGEVFRGQPLTDSDLFTDAERRSDPFYQEFLKGFGLGNFVGTVVSPLPGFRYMLNLEGNRPFESSQVETFALLAPHVSRALAATTRLRLTEALSGDLAAALEHSSCGVMFLSSDGRVGFVNGRARQLLGDGLTIEDGAVRSASPGNQKSVDALIGSVLLGSRPVENVFVSRPSGEVRLMLQGVPIPAHADRTFERLGMATCGGLLLIHDLSGERPRSVQAELQRMGLSPAQARIAELVGSGCSPREAGRETGVVESTARAQLKKAYGRLGLSRQSELAILVTKLRAVRDA